MKTLGKVAVTFIVGALVLGRIVAQSDSALQPVTNPPEVGTFFLLSGETSGAGSPPYPYDPYGGVMPVYQMPGVPNQFFIADTVEDFQALQSLKAGTMLSGGMTMNSLEFPGEGEGEGGGEWTNNYVSPVYTTNDLYLTWLDGSVTNEQGTLELHIPENLLDETWFVWATTNLSVSADPWALSVSNWTWVAAAEPGQTNITVPLLSDDTCFYRLAHPDNDGDFDGLTDYWSCSTSVMHWAGPATAHSRRMISIRMGSATMTSLSRAAIPTTLPPPRISPACS